MRLLIITITLLVRKTFQRQLFVFSRTAVVLITTSSVCYM